MLAGLGQLHYEKDDFAAADNHYRQALDHGRSWPPPGSALPCTCWHGIPGSCQGLTRLHASEPRFDC